MAIYPYTWFWSSDLIVHLVFSSKKNKLEGWSLSPAWQVPGLTGNVYRALVICLWVKFEAKLDFTLQANYFFFLISCLCALPFMLLLLYHDACLLETFLEVLDNLKYTTGHKCRCASLSSGQRHYRWSAKVNSISRKGSEQKSDTVYHEQADRWCCTQLCAVLCYHPHLTLKW